MKLNRFAASATLALLPALACAGPGDRQSNPFEVKGSQAAPAPQGGCQAITDNVFVTPTAGTAGMTCLTVASGAGLVNNPVVSVGVNHTWLGDLTVKVVPPGGSPLVTLFSRPGRTGGTGVGDSSDLTSANPLSFADAFADDAETMGNTIGGTNFACADDGRCNFFTNSDEEAAGNLATLNGLDASGMWQVCVGDGAAGDTGEICSASITYQTTSADVGVTVDAPSGVLTGGQFTYVLTASNAGPDAADNVVVTDVLDADVTFVSSTCGASHAAGTVTWNVGTLANGASASCTVTVAMGAVCAQVTNNASVTSDAADGNAANDTDTDTNGGGNLVADPSFEVGSPSTDWVEVEATFGTPLCTIAGCGVGGGTGPLTGDWWAWFGGFGTGPTSGSMTQSIVIPAGSNTLTFFLETPVCANGASDFMRVLVDGNELFRVDSTDGLCNTVGYRQVSVDISAFANGASHTVAFDSSTIGAGNPSNFFVDDVEITSAPTCGVAGSPLPLPIAPENIPATDHLRLVLLAVMIGLLGLFVVRRQQL